MLSRANIAISSILIVAVLGGPVHYREEDCVSFGPNGPTAVKIPVNKTVSFGETVTFDCEGNFGCGSPDTRSVDWIAEKRKVPEEDSEYVWDFSTKPTYTVDKYSSKNSAFLGSTLTISGVAPDDFLWTFNCIMSSARIVKPTLYFSVHLDRFETIKS